MLNMVYIKEKKDKLLWELEKNIENKESFI
jgi:hypothetical protein